MKFLVLLCYAHKKNKVTKLYKPQTIKMCISYTTCVHIVNIIRLFNWVLHTKQADNPPISGPLTASPSANTTK